MLGKISLSEERLTQPSRHDTRMLHVLARQIRVTCTRNVCTMHLTFKPLQNAQIVQKKLQHRQEQPIKLKILQSSSATQLKIAQAKCTEKPTSAQAITRRPALLQHILNRLKCYTYKKFELIC